MQIIRRYGLPEEMVLNYNICQMFFHSLCLWRIWVKNRGRAVSFQQFLRVFKMPRKFRLGLTNFCHPTQKETLWKTSLLPDDSFICSRKSSKLLQQRLILWAFQCRLHQRPGGSCNCDRRGMDNAVYQCPGTCECSGGPWQTCILQFCNLPQYFTRGTKVSKESFWEWHNCFWHILKFPTAQTNHGAEAVATPATQIPGITGNHSWSPRNAWAWIRTTVLGVWMPPAKLPLLKRRCWAEWAISFCCSAKLSCYNGQVTRRDRCSDCWLFFFFFLKKTLR